MDKITHSMQISKLLCFSFPFFFLKISYKRHISSAEWHFTICSQWSKILSWQEDGESKFEVALMQHLRPLEATRCAITVLRAKIITLQLIRKLFSLIGVIYLTGHTKLQTVAQRWHGNWNKSPYPFLMPQYHWELNGPLPLLWAYQWFITLRLKCNSNRLHWIIKTTVGNLEPHICEEMERADVQMQAVRGYNDL